MLENKTVKVRFKKYYAEQKSWVFIGKVLKCTEHWIMLDGKGILVIKGSVHPADIDTKKRVLLIPRDNIAHIRILPENFDIDEIKIETRGIRIFAVVKDGPDTSISEI